MTELLPCPFCGAPARDDLLPHHNGPGWVQCSACECDQHMSDTREEAVARWNTRAISPEAGERLWCKACGTVTRRKVCDCNEYGVGHEMYREPNFVNYADSLAEDAHKLSNDLVVAVATSAEALRIIEALLGLELGSGEAA